MNKFFQNIINPTKLSIAMFYYVIVGIFSAFFCYIALSNGLNLMAGMLTDQKNYYQKNTEALAEDFQNYITDNEISIEDNSRISDWNYDNWYVFLTVYQDNRIYYNTIDQDNKQMKNEIKEEYPVLSHYYPYRHEKSVNYPIEFTDTSGAIVLRAYFEAKFRTLIFIFSAGMSALCFAMVVLLLLRKKLRYITQIEKGIHILEAGGEDYRIPLKGRDELYFLVSSINRMSDSLHEEIRQKDKIQEERNEMVTALSHDIRTPLTSVLFYLDLITDKKCTENQTEIYMQKAKKQAYHMKRLMEDLFTYSYAAGEEPQVKPEEYDGNELFGQLIGDLTESLIERGFRPEVSYEIEQPFKIESDAVQLKRVFDNLGTNIVKYARKDQPVHFRLYLMGERVYMVQENPISDEKIEVESFGIGVKASQKIVAQMGGDFTYESSHYQYKTGISFEIKKE